MNDTLYMFEGWLREDAKFDAKYYSYESLLECAIGKGSVLLYIQDDDYQGDWVAVVSDGKRIGLVNGYFGSCSGCDELEGAASENSYRAVAEMYLQSVRTFSSWELLHQYIGELGDNWNFRFGRERITELASVGMPLGAMDIFGCLMSDTPGLDPVEAAKSAKALH